MKRILLLPVVLLAVTGCGGGSLPQSPPSASPAVSSAGAESAAHALWEKRREVAAVKFVPAYRKAFPVLAEPDRKEKYLARIGSDICSDFDQNKGRTVAEEMQTAFGRIEHNTKPTAKETRAIIALAINTTCPEHKPLIQK